MGSKRAGAVRVLVIGVLVVTAIGTRGPAGAAAPLSGFQTVGTAPAGPAGAVPSAAPLPPSLTASVVLLPGDPAGLAAYARAASTPGNPAYRRFLDPGQVRARFGPSPAVVAQVRQWLSSNDLTVGAVTGDGTIVPVTGTPTGLAAAFHTALRNYRLPSGRVAFANTSAPRVPSSLAPDIQGVVGLDDLAEFRTGARASSAPPVQASSPVQASRAAQSSPSAAGPSGPPPGPQPCAAATTGAASQIFDPATSGGQGAPGAAATADRIASALGYSGLYAHGDLGQGTTVGIVMGGGDYSDSDLSTYEDCYGLQAPVTRVPVDGGVTGVYGYDSLETTLDVESVVSFAPEADVLVYEVPSLTPASVLDDLAAVVQDDRADVVTESLGGCEILSTSQYAESTLFEEMAAQGQTMFASSGDSGSTSCLDVSSLTPAAATQLAVSDPGSQPFVTSVGGATLTDLSAPSSTNVSVWNWGPTASGTEGGTGGASATWAMPAWQQGADANGSANDPAVCGPSGSSSCREVPDVAGNGDFRNGMVLYLCVPFGNCSPGSPQGWEFSQGGGTSQASPDWAALAALIDEGVPGHRVGLLSPALYRVAAVDPSAFLDVTQGGDDVLTAANNFVAGGGSGNYTCSYGGSSADQPCYQATPGFDMATGLGLPVGTVLAADVQALAVPPFAVTTTALPAAVVGTPYTAALGATGGVQPYRWSVTQGRLPAGLVLGPDGTISGTPTRAGTAAFVARAADSTVGVPRTDDAVLSIAVSPAAAGFHGSMGGKVLDAPVVGLAATPDGQGYWEVAADGGVFAFGDAGFHGSMGGKALDAPVVGLAATPDGEGYWEVAADGGIFAFGDAGFHGSMGGKLLDAPVVGLAATPDGQGYGEVAADGGIFAFGDAAFHGSMGGRVLDAPVVGLAATPDGQGYWEVAADGGIFAFGDAAFHGSMGGKVLDAPVVGLAATPDGQGYGEVAADGGMFAFGDAGFHGSMSGKVLGAAVVGLAATPDGQGYWEVASDGGVFAFS